MRFKFGIQYEKKTLSCSLAMLHLMAMRDANMNGKQSSQTKSICICKNKNHKILNYASVKPKRVQFGGVSEERGWGRSQKTNGCHNSQNCGINVFIRNWICDGTESTTKNVQWIVDKRIHMNLGLFAIQTPTRIIFSFFCVSNLSFGFLLKRETLKFLSKEIIIFQLKWFFRPIRNATSNFRTSLLIDLLGQLLSAVHTSRRIEM